jgi:hypothetical protein
MQTAAPDIEALEQRNQQALGLHEDGLWGADLRIQAKHSFIKSEQAD